MTLNAQGAEVAIVRWAQVGWVRGQNFPDVSAQVPADELSNRTAFIGRYYEIKSNLAQQPPLPASVYLRRFFQNVPANPPEYYGIAKTQASGAWQPQIPQETLNPELRQQNSGWAGAVLNRADYNGEVKRKDDRMPGNGVLNPVAFIECIVFEGNGFARIAEFFQGALPAGNTKITDPLQHNVRVDGAPGSDQFSIWTINP